MGMTYTEWLTIFTATDGTETIAYSLSETDAIQWGRDYANPGETFTVRMGDQL